MFTVTGEGEGENGLVVIDNATDTAQISAKKTWGGNAWLDGMKVVFELQDENGHAVTTNAAGETISATQEVTSLTDIAEWTGLEKYYVENGTAKLHEYKVVEKEVWYNTQKLTKYRDIFTVSGEGTGTDGLVIIDNAPDLTEISGQKTWNTNGAWMTGRTLSRIFG